MKTINTCLYWSHMQFDTVFHETTLILTNPSNSDIFYFFCILCFNSPTHLISWCVWKYSSSSKYFAYHSSWPVRSKLTLVLWHSIPPSWILYPTGIGIFTLKIFPVPLSTVYRTYLFQFFFSLHKIIIRSLKLSCILTSEAYSWW